MFILTVCILVVLFVLVVLFLIGHIKTGNESHTMQELSLPLECLLNRGLDGGTLILSVKKSTEFLQFTKHILGEGHYGIQMDFHMVSILTQWWLPDGLRDGSGWVAGLLSYG